MIDDITARMLEEDMSTAQIAFEELIHIKNIYKPGSYEDFVSVGTSNGKTYIITVSEVDNDEL